MSNMSGDTVFGSGSTSLIGVVGEGDIGAKSDSDSMVCGECVASPSSTFDVNAFFSFLGDDGGAVCILLVILDVGCSSRWGVICGDASGSPFSF